MNHLSKRNLLPFLLGCFLLATSCGEDEAEKLKPIRINGGTLELTAGYRSEWKDASGLEKYYYQFGLIGNGLTYDPEFYRYSGTGDLAHFTFYTSSPGLPNGTYEFPSSGSSGIMAVNFFRSYTGITQMGDPYTFKERFQPMEGYIEVSRSGDVYTFNFTFTKYLRYVDSDNESPKEIENEITGSYSGSVEQVVIP